MSVKVLLVAVSDYSNIDSLPSLPFCKNDLFEMKNSLIRGLGIEATCIDMLGENGTVNKSDLIDALEYKSYDLFDDDILIFYFSGHGGKVDGNNCLLFSDGKYSLQTLIEEIDKTNVKSKIVFLDCCHSGNFVLDKELEFNITDDVDNFAGSGIAILASCGANEQSGFDSNRSISLFTRFLTDAINNKFISRQGKKSLEAIAELVRRYANIWNSNNTTIIQHPIYRAAIGGTVFFNVEDYKPYKVASFYEECENYIIYKVEPLHTGIAKRLSAKVILRYPSSLEEIAGYAEEIRNKLLYCEVFQTQKAQKYYSGKPANIIWCYFGYDEDDMVDSNYICHTTWVDENQNKNWWYKENKNSHFVNGVFFNIHTGYESIKNLKNKELDINKFIRDTKECTSNIVTFGEKYISLFREYQNGILSEDQFINLSQQYIQEISKWYFKETSLDIPPNDLHEWSQVQTELAGSLHDCTLYYNKEFLDRWKPENRKWLMQNSIKQYNSDLEKYKELDIEIAKKYPTYQN